MRNNLFQKRIGLFTKFLVIVPIFLFVIFVSSTFLRYYSLDFKDTSTLGNFQLNGVKGTKSLLVLGVDKDENGNEFVDYISIMTLEKYGGEIKIFNINPKFSPFIAQYNQYVPFKSLLVFLKTYYPQNNYIDMYLEYIEKIFTIKIDGYVIVTKHSLEKLGDSLGNFNVSAPSNLTDDDIPGLVIHSGNNNIPAENLLEFLSADQNGDNDKLQRQLSVIQSLGANLRISNLVISQNKILEVITDGVQTNLDGSDLLKLFWRLKFDKNKYKVGYTSSDAAIRIKEELDERWYTVFNTLDKDVKKVFVKENVKMEQANLDVFNATDVTGLARTKARWLENRGFRVVLVGNTDKKYEKTTIYINTQKDYPNTLNEIYNTLDSKEIDIKQEKYDGRSVGDIVVILGDNEIKDM